MADLKKSILFLAVSALIVPMLVFAAADFSSAEPSSSEEEEQTVTVIIYDDVTTKIRVGETLDSIDVEQREGYAFDYWMCDGEKIDSSTVVTADMTNITGNWMEVKVSAVNLSNNSAIVVVIIVASLIVITLVKGRFD